MVPGLLKPSLLWKAQLVFLQPELSEEEQHSDPSVLPGLFQLYGYDLESEFSQFQDWLKTFPLCKGRANADDFEEDEEERFMGKYKVLVAPPSDPERLGVLIRLPSPLRDPSWFTPSMRKTQRTQPARSPKESPRIQPSKSWSGLTSSR